MNCNICSVSKTFGNRAGGYIKMYLMTIDNNNR